MSTPTQVQGKFLTSIWENRQASQQTILAWRFEISFLSLSHRVIKSKKAQGLLTQPLPPRA